MRAGAFKCKCKYKRRIKYKCKCSASESNANENAQQLIQMHLNKMQVHLNQMQMHLDQMQMLFYNYVFCVQPLSDMLQTYLVTTINKKLNQ